MCYRDIKDVLQGCYMGVKALFKCITGVLEMVTEGVTQMGKNVV